MWYINSTFLAFKDCLDVAGKEDEVQVFQLGYLTKMIFGRALLDNKVGCAWF